MILFDDISVGERFVSASRTIFDADIVNFAGLSGDFSRLHIDDTFAATSSYGRRIAHGMLIASIVSGLRSKLDDYAILGLLETNRRFRKPTFPGDTITAHFNVQKCEPSKSRPAMGIVNLVVSVVNQRGEIIQDGSDVVAVERRTA